MVDTQPVTDNGASLTVDDGGTTVSVDDGGGSLTVDGTVAVSNFPATQPVSGTVTDNQGTPNSVGNAWPVKNTDGTNTAAVKAASTAAAATDPALTVALSPNSPIPTGANTIGALTANQSVNNAQIGGSAIVASVTGVQDVMPRKRSGSTGLSPNYTAFRITTNTTTTVTAATGYVSSIVIVVSGAGTAWTIKVQNKEGTPKILYPATTAALGASTPVSTSEPILATSGIDIVTAGTTPGTVDVFVTYWQ